jgi:hypothetical protein
MKKMIAILSLVSISSAAFATKTVTATGNTAKNVIESLVAANLVQAPQTDLPRYTFSAVNISCTYDIRTPTSFREKFSCSSDGKYLMQAAFLVDALENAIGNDPTGSFEDAASGKISLTVKSVGCILSHTDGSAICSLSN